MKVYDGLGTMAVTRAIKYWKDEISRYVPNYDPWVFRIVELSEYPEVRVHSRVPTRAGRVAECDIYSNGAVTIRIMPGWEHHWTVVAHELGHALGLEHDDDHPIMCSLYENIRRM